MPVCELFVRPRAGVFRSCCRTWAPLLAAACSGLVSVQSVFAQAADTPPIDLAMSFRPTQADVDYERVDKANYGKCTIDVEQQGKASGWVVSGPEGQILRRFLDTNGDNVVDQWRYYDRGYEVYRDMDTNFNNKVDQSRWLNTGGTRWGIDTNEDGRLDRWKMISAEEATREAILAMASGTASRLERVLVTADDADKIGLAPPMKKELMANVAGVAEKMRQRVSATKVIGQGTQWVRFDSSMLMPYIIPADEGKANQDMLVYENVMAIVETAGETGFVQIGEVLKVGDAWRLTQIPAPIEGDMLQITDGGVLMQPASPAGQAGMLSQSDITPAMQKLLTDLQQLDANAPTPQSTAAELARYNSKRVEILSGLLASAQSEDERVQWLTQMIDGLAAAVQTGKYPEGVRQLTAVENDLKQQRPKSKLIPYTAYRRLLADYTVKLQAAMSDAEKREELQTWWLEQLKGFVEQYPDADDSADALLQLAITEEFSGNADTAKKWYTQLVDTHPKTDAGARARGALKRLSLEGKSITLTGKGLDGKPVDLASYKGKAVLVIFWATWCQPCTEDLPQIKALYDEYRSKGFEIVGVNLDTQREAVAPYIAEHGNNWPHIAQPDGLDGNVAVDFGVISVPTMFLIDKTGKVASNSTSVEDMKELLPELLE